MELYAENHSMPLFTENFAGPSRKNCGLLPAKLGLQKMGQTFFVCVQSSVEIGAHIATGDEKQWCFSFLCAFLMLLKVGVA